MISPSSRSLIYSAAILDDYAALKAAGHSPAKAGEILLDAKRGDTFCQQWIEFARQHVGPKP